MASGGRYPYRGRSRTEVIDDNRHPTLRIRSSTQTATGGSASGPTAGPSGGPSGYPRTQSTSRSRRLTFPPQLPRRGVGIDSPEVRNYVNYQWRSGYPETGNLWQFRPRTRSEDSEDIEMPLAELRLRLMVQKAEEQQRGNRTLRQQSDYNVREIHREMAPKSRRQFVREFGLEERDGRWHTPPELRPVPFSGAQGSRDYLFTPQVGFQPPEPNPPDANTQRIRNESDIRDEAWSQQFPNSSDLRNRRTHQSSTYMSREQLLSRVRDSMRRRRQSIGTGEPLTRDTYMTNPQMPTAVGMQQPFLPPIVEMPAYEPQSNAPHRPIDIPGFDISRTPSAATVRQQQQRGQSDLDQWKADMERNWSQYRK